MQKSKIIPEDWILIALMNASERYGFDLDNWYQFKRPDRLNIDREDFLRIRNKMEDDGILKRASADAVNYCLSEKGKKEAIRLKRRLNFTDYSLIISNFPEIELKEKVETVEAFIVTSFLMIVMVYPGIIPITKYINIQYANFIILLINSIILMLLIYYFSKYFSKIFVYWMFSLQRNSLWIYQDWLWNNKNKFMFPIPAIFIILLLSVVYITNIVSWQNILWGIILLIIGYIITHYRELVSKISNFRLERK